MLWVVFSSQAFAAEPSEFLTILTLNGKPDAPVLGKVEFQLTEDETTLLYKIMVNGIEDITMSHIHLGSIGDLNTPVVWLYPPGPPPKLIPGSFTGVLAQGDITARDLIGPLHGQPLNSLLALMRQEKVFVNIHGKKFAAGEICGQLRCLVH